MKNDPKETSRKSSRFDETMNNQYTRVKNSEDNNDATYVLDLLKSGEGACITYISETTQV